MTFDYGWASYESRDDFTERSGYSWNPGRTKYWQEAGIELVIDRREDYYIYDMAGKRLIDVHLNGGTFNLGHRNLELVDTLETAMERFDLGNHHFPSVARTAFAEQLVASAGPTMRYATFGTGGSEATDIAIKSARFATQRRKIVSVLNGYHGHTGLAMDAGEDRFRKMFLSDHPDEFPRVPWNDLDAMEHELSQDDVAAVLIETIPATYGFPLPLPGYLEAVKALCERHGALYIADEVQTGLMRTGEMWAIYGYGVEPDMIVTAKGLCGGLYPISAVILNERSGAWMHEDGYGHISTAGGSELGCIVGMKVIEISSRPEVRSIVGHLNARIENAFVELQEAYPDFLLGVRHRGLVNGLEFPPPDGAVAVMRALYRNGVWGIFSKFERSVLQFKPGLLVSPTLCDDLLERLAVSIDQAAKAWRPGRRTAA